MFNLFKKKSNINLENIKNFKEAIKTIKFFIVILEWEKAEKAIAEIQRKEELWFNSINEKLSLEIENRKWLYFSTFMYYNVKIRVWIAITVEVILTITTYNTNHKHSTSEGNTIQFDK